MLQTLKDSLRGTSLYSFIRERKYKSRLYYLARRRTMRRLHKSWLSGENPCVSWRRKIEVIDGYRRDFDVSVMVETGTYLGDTPDALRNHFNRIFSIELDPTLHRWASWRLRKHSHIHVLLGDSSTILGSILAELEEAALFWLDAHYSQGQTTRGELNTPIMRELELICGSPIEHVVLIDDARSFTGLDDYPSLDQVRDLVGQIRPTWEVHVADDIIRLHSRTHRESGRHVSHQ